MKIIAVFFTVICVLVLDILCQLSTYQSRYRPDCEYKQCMKPIRNHGNCPRWGSCQWYCQAKLANCTVGTRYHCARDLRNLEQFTNACAVEIFCLSGEEPHLSVQESTGKASVNCRPCYKNNVYNSRLNTSSATFSECKMLKKNLCRKEDNKIDCGNRNYTELTKTDGYCRCDARNGYAARSPKTCFYEYEVCFVKKCPEGMELLLNYTCGMLCPTGYARQPASDICTKVSVTRPFTSDRPELHFTDVQTTSIRTSDAPSTNEQRYKQIIIPICLSVFVITILLSVFVITILFRRQYKGSESQITNDTDGKGTTNRENTSPTNAMSSPAIPVDGDSGAQVTATVVIETQDIPAAIPVNGDSGAQVTAMADIETQDIPGVDHMKDKLESKPTGKATLENKNTSVRTKPSQDIPTTESDSEGLPGQKWCADLYRRLPQEGFIDISVFDFDNLKDRTIIEPTSLPTIQAIHVDGFVPYAISGKKITNVYELFSHLICGSDQLKYTLQCAAAHFGIKYFGKYRKKLTEAFQQSKTQFIDAKIFFEIHGIYIEEFQLTEESVPQNLDKLLQEMFVTEITGPFHAELLSGVLDCNIIQHFENNRFYDRDVRTITGLNVNAESRKRELHIYWGKAAKNEHSYCLIPMFKKDDQTFTQNTNVSQIKMIEMDSRNCIGAQIAKQESFSWRPYFKTFEKSQHVVYEELQNIEFLKPDCAMRTINVHGFKAYEKPSGEFYSVYEMLSYLLCGDNSLMFILRLAAARYAKTHFETYVSELTKTFHDCFEANVFFKAHGITLNEQMTWPMHKRESVSDAFDRLVREAVHDGKGNAPFYVEFLSGVLNRKINQHFEGKTYDGEKVNRIAGLDVSLTDASSGLELHVYWMKSKDRVKKMSYWIFPLFKCVLNCPGMELCERIYAFLKNDMVFKENTCLDMINTRNIFEFDKLKEKDIIKTNKSSMQIIQTIKVEGFTAYEMPGDETSCMYEFMSNMLFGNADMKYIMRLAAMRYALQNFWQYVNKLTGEFGKRKSVSSRVNDAKLFFEIHSIEFKETESSSMEKCVLMSFTDLVREIANTGQGPFYVEFLRGALNCKIKQFFDIGLYKRPLSEISGCYVTLTTSSPPERASSPPERELHIYRKKTFRFHGGLSNHYKIVPLLKNEDRSKTDI